jgi:hypothetical protein
MPRSRSKLDADGAERPPFLRRMPRDPDLDRVVAAFERGDYARVRREAPALAERSEDARVRRAALELRRRIDPDPLARIVLLAAVALLLFLVVWTYAAH